MRRVADCFVPPHLALVVFWGGGGLALLGRDSVLVLLGVCNVKNPIGTRKKVCSSTLWGIGKETRYIHMQLVRKSKQEKKNEH